MASKRRWMLGVGLVLGALATMVVYEVIARGRGFAAPPSETLRVHHPAGFSIVAVEGWETQVGTDERSGVAEILVSPGTRARYQPSYQVRSGTGTLDEPWYKHMEFKPGSFQGQPARIYDGPQGKYSSWQAVFEREGRWYHLSVMVHGYGDDVKPSEKLMAYVQTFRVETGAGAATRPADLDVGD